MARAAMAAPTVATVLRAPLAEHLVGCLEMQTASVGSVQATAVLTARAVVYDVALLVVESRVVAVAVNPEAKPALMTPTVAVLSPEAVAAAKEVP